jgi:hypothetical protein
LIITLSRHLKNAEIICWNLFLKNDSTIVEKNRLIFAG